MDKLVVNHLEMYIWAVLFPVLGYNKAAMNIYVHVLKWTYISFFFCGKNLGLKWLGHVIDLHLIV